MGNPFIKIMFRELKLDYLRNFSPVNSAFLGQFSLQNKFWWIVRGRWVEGDVKRIEALKWLVEYAQAKNYLIMCWFIPRNGFVTPSFSPKLRHQPLSDLLEVKIQMKLDLCLIQVSGWPWIRRLNPKGRGRAKLSVYHTWHFQRKSQARGSFITYHLIIDKCIWKCKQTNNWKPYFTSGGNYLSQSRLPFIAFVLPL